MKTTQCVCSLCCFGFPCDEYTWERASQEAFGRGEVEAALVAEGIEVAGVITINLAASVGQKP